MIVCVARRLVSLNVANTKIDDVGLNHVACEIGESLRSLDISRTKVTDEGVTLLVGRASRLNVLSLAEVGLTITDASMRAIAESLPGLQSLDVSGCEAITDTGIRSIGSKCFALEHLKLAFCKAVTKASFDVFQENEILLETLDINCCRLNHADLIDKVARVVLGSSWRQ